MVEQRSLKPYVVGSSPTWTAMEIIKKIPWNKGKRKPIIDDLGNKWCNCIEPKLVRNILPEDKGQAYCILCHNHWYH